MTHSLHRCGRLQENDFVWLLYHVKGVNDQNFVERLRKAIGIVEEVGSVNWGDVKSGPIVSVPLAEIKEKVTEKSRIRGVFTSRDQVTKFLKKMKEADLGFCVIISGILDQVFSACQEAGVKPHTMNYSLGVFGNKKLLADEDTLAITTMCGHHMIPDDFVAETRERVKDGKLSPEKASLEFAELCPCGIFNQERARELLILEREDLNISGKKG
jgi:hypothetical protein